MKHLNISGNFSPTKKTSKDQFLKAIQEDFRVHDYTDKNDTDHNNKLKLGRDEHEFSFNFTIESRKTPVLIYLQLDIKGETIEVIESFSGLNNFVDIKMYENQLLSILKDTAFDNFHYEFSVDAHSTGYHQK